MAERSKNEFFARELPKIEERLETRKKELPEGEGAKPEREILREVLREHAQELAKTGTPHLAPPPKLQQELKSMPIERQVIALVDVAFEKGLEQAIVIARSLNDPHLLDAFHDALVDHFFEELVQRRKIHSQET